jgi:hypothetical protein
MIKVDDQKRQEAMDRFVALAGLSEAAAEGLVEAALQAAVDQTLDTIMGSGPVPSAVTAIRADSLRYICLHAGRALTQREVGVLFRTTPANARSILVTMSATYEQALRAQFVAEMRAAANVEQAGSNDEGFTWRVRFSQRSDYDTARAELERLGFLKFAIFHETDMAVEFDQTVSSPRGPINILDRLGLQPPSTGKRKQKS